MKKKYALYCTGNATVIRNFYRKYSTDMYKLEFCLYDGKRLDIKQQLQTICKNNIFDYEGNINDCLLENLLNNKIDYMFCFGDKILKGPLLDKYKNKIINFHPSILPSFSGLNAIDAALEDGVQILGNTAHFVDTGVDTGPIIMQSAIPRSTYENYDSVFNLQITMLKKIWNYLDDDKIKVNNKQVTIEASFPEENSEMLYTA